MMPRWLLYTLLTMALWGGLGLLSKPASNVMSGWEVQTLSAIGLVPVIVALLLSRKVREGTQQGFWLGFSSGVLGSLGNVAYFQALGMGGKAAAVTPFTALYPIVTIILAVSFLRERLNAMQVAGALLSLLALYCFNVGAQAAFLTPWLMLALLPIAFWGVTGFLQKLASNRASGELVTTAFLLGQLPVALLTPMFVKVTWAAPGRIWVLVLALGLLLGLGNLTSILAYRLGGKASVVTPMASLYSIVTIPLAVLLLGERISPREGLGIVFALVAAVGLCWEGPAWKSVPASAEPKPS